MWFIAFKFIFYVFFTFSLAHVISLEGFNRGIESEYSEYSLTELLQSLFVLVSAFLFLYAFYLKQNLKPISLSLFALMLMMFVRESDIYLDEFVFDGAWQTIVSFIILFMGTYLWKRRASISQAAIHFSQLSSNGLLICGLVVTLVFSRLMGRGSFWQSVLGDDYVYLRRVKNIVEEGTELLGYSLILFAAMELTLYCLAQRKDQRKAPLSTH